MVRAVAEQFVNSFQHFDRHKGHVDHSTRGPLPAPGVGRDAGEVSAGLRDRLTIHGDRAGAGFGSNRSFGIDFQTLGRSIQGFLKTVGQTFADQGTRSLFDRQGEAPATITGDVDDRDDDDGDDDGSLVATRTNRHGLQRDDEERLNRGMVFKALNGMGRDLRHMLRELGFGGGFAADLAHAFAKGAKEAFKQGIDFAAEITVAAAREVTSITDNGIEQSLSLVARQLSIEINHDKDTVSIAVASLSVESSIEIEAEFAQADAGTDEAPVTDATDTPLTGAAAVEALIAPTADEKTREAAAVLQDLVAFESRFQLHIVERLRNEDGHSVTRLLVDAAIRLSQPESEDEVTPAVPSRPVSQQLAVA